MFKGYITYFCIFWSIADFIPRRNSEFHDILKTLKMFRGQEEGIFFNDLTFSGFPWPYQPWWPVQGVDFTIIIGMITA